MDTDLIKRRLGWYGLAWLVSFIVVLLVGVVGHYALKMDTVRLADVFIPIGLVALGVAAAGVVLMDLSGKSSGGTKLAIFILAVLLLLPLLWAPVSAMVVAAYLDPARSITYSGAYAQFRITVSQLIYPLVAMLGDDPLISFVWQAFQVVASVVGAVASVLQVWRVVRPFLYEEDEEVAEA